MVDTHNTEKLYAKTHLDGKKLLLPSLDLSIVPSVVSHLSNTVTLLKHTRLFDLILYVPSTIFQLNRDGSSWVKPVLSYDKCALLKAHNAVTPVRLEPAASRSRVKHSTTEPPRYL